MVVWCTLTLFYFLFSVYFSHYTHTTMFKLYKKASYMRMSKPSQPAWYSCWCVFFCSNAWLKDWRIAGSVVTNQRGWVVPRIPVRQLSALHYSPSLVFFSRSEASLCFSTYYHPPPPLEHFFISLVVLLLMLWQILSSTMPYSKNMFQEEYRPCWRNGLYSILSWGRLTWDGTGP